MIKKVLYYVVFIIWIITTSNLLLLPSYILNKQKDTAMFLKKKSQTILSFILTEGFQTNLYYHRKIIPSKDKVDIVMINHISTVDFTIILAIFDYWNIHYCNIIMKNDIIFIPGIGFVLLNTNDIKINRHWNKDQQLLEKSISRLEKGLIIIFPEGRRYNYSRHKSAIQFSKERGIPIYKNTLVPRVKGIWKIISELNKNNTLGKIYDMSIFLSKFHLKEAYIKDILCNDIGDAFIITRELHKPSLVTMSNLDNFKIWFYNMWKEKDIIISNKTAFSYLKAKPKYSKSDYIFVISFVIIFIGMIKKFKGKMLGTLMLLSYLIITVNYFRLKKTEKMF